MLTFEHVFALVDAVEACDDESTRKLLREAAVEVNGLVVMDHYDELENRLFPQFHCEELVEELPTPDFRSYVQPFSTAGTLSSQKLDDVEAWIRSAGIPIELIDAVDELLANAEIPLLVLDMDEYLGLRDVFQAARDWFSNAAFDEENTALEDKVFSSVVVGAE